jgi:general secretion pathway protein N
MISLVQRHPLAVALGAVAALLLLALALETATLRPGLTGVPARRATPYEAKLLPSLAAADPERLYPEVTARPLFIPTRRPAPAAAAASAFTRGQYVLQGVIVVGDNRVALVKEKASGRVHRIEKGKDLNGVKVADIAPESVTLGEGAEQEVLSLQVQKIPAGPASTAAVGPFSGSAAHGAPRAAVAPLPVPQPKGGGLIRPDLVDGAARPVGPGESANPRATAVPQAATAPMSPEELLARRRARRALQNQ